MKSSRVLYLTRNGLLEPLGQSQIFPYIKYLSKSYQVTLISFEKTADRLDSVRIRYAYFLCAKHRIRWLPLRFRLYPRVLAPAFGIVQLFLFAFCQYLLVRPQLVHARSYVPAVIALLLHRLTGIPFIFDMRALWLEELITSSRLERGSLLHRALLLLERRCLKEASGVVTLTQASLAYLQAQYACELVGSIITVIPTCVDLHRFTFTERPPECKLVIGCIGTILSGWFLVDWLRAFFDAIARIDSSARFEIISQDVSGAIYAALQPPSTWVERIKITSAHPDEMPAVIQTHSASVMFYAGGALSELGRSPTRMAEVLGCGRPIVANSGVGDVEDILRYSRVGVLAESDSSVKMDACALELLALLRDPQLSSRCRRTAEQFFSLESGSAAYGKLYSQILGS